MARLKIRLLLSATLALSTGGLFLAAAAPAAGAAAAPAAVGGALCIAHVANYAKDIEADALTYGADYPGTRFDYGKADQFATTLQCGGPFGPNSTYCVTIIKPVPLRN
jgi:hypothetical protein